MECPVCDGSGISPGTLGRSWGPVTCGACHGSGFSDSGDEHSSGSPSWEDDDEPEPAEGRDEAEPPAADGLPSWRDLPWSFGVSSRPKGPGASDSPGRGGESARGARQSPFGALESHRSFQGHLDAILGKAARGQEQDSRDWSQLPIVEQLRIESAIDRRHTAALPDITVGRARPETARELERVVADYRRLANARTGPWKPALVARMLEKKIAGASRDLGQVRENLGDLAAAEEAYTTATSLYARLGDRDGVRRGEASLRALRQRRDRDTDADFDDLHTRLDAATDDLDRAELLLDLADLHAGHNDRVQATDWYHRAERILSRYRGDAGGAATANALVASLSAVFGNEQVAGSSPIERSMRIRGLLRRLYHGLSAVLAPDAAAPYLDRLADLDGTTGEGNRDNIEFSAKTKDALSDLLSAFERGIAGEDEPQR